jgi:hypothetical protein
LYNHLNKLIALDEIVKLNKDFQLIQSLIWHKPYD